MRYLLCDKCGAYYKLKLGDSTADFESCECGGELKYINSPEDFSDFSEQMANKNVEHNKKAIIGVVGVLLGSVVMLMPYFISSPYWGSGSFVLINILPYIFWLIGGFTASFLSSTQFKYGILTGFIVALISGLVVIVQFHMMMTNSFAFPTLAQNIGVLLALSLIYIIIPGLFSIIGGIIGILARKKFY